MLKGAKKCIITPLKISTGSKTEMQGLAGAGLIDILNCSGNTVCISRKNNRFERVKEQCTFFSHSSTRQGDIYISSSQV